MYSTFQPDQATFSASYLRELKSYFGGGLNRQQLSTYQTKRLLDIIEHCRSNSDFYEKTLAKIEFGDSARRQAPEEITKCLPFTTKDDLRSAGLSICSAPLNEAWVYYETTGTTGKATPCPRNYIDSIVNNSFLTLQYEKIFSGQKHIIGVMGPTELHSTGDTFEDVFRSLGHTVVKMWPRSPVVGMERAVKLIQELGITALVCTPAVASELLKLCRDMQIDPKTLDLEVLLFLGELISPARQRNISSSWCVRGYNCMYASQEASIMAATNSNNELETIPLNVFVELINPDTGSPIAPISPGAQGELVITHLYKGFKPLLRYRTGDMVRVEKADGNCWTIQPIGRAHDRMSIQGREVTAYDLETTIFQSLSECIEFAIQVEDADQTDLVTVVLERCNELTEPSVLAQVKRSILDQLGIEASVKVGDVGKSIGTGAMVSWKAARIQDYRSPPSSEHIAALQIIGAR